MSVGPDTQVFSHAGRARCRVDTISGCAVVSACGDIDLYTTFVLHRAVHAALRLSSSLIIDLEFVSFMDSTGLGVLIAARNRVNVLGGSVSLVAPPALVRRLLNGTQLGQHFGVFDTVQEAVRAARTLSS